MSAALQLLNNSETNQRTDSQVNALVEEYCRECGFTRLPWMKQEISQLVNEGFEIDLLQEVIARTARAPRPSWAYFSAIIRSCRIAGLYDLFSFLSKGYRAYKSQDDLPY